MEKSKLGIAISSAHAILQALEKARDQWIDETVEVCVATLDQASTDCAALVTQIDDASAGLLQGDLP